MLSSGYIQDGQVVFFEGADRIYQKEFRRKKISGVSIPDTIQAIQSEAFASCDLTSITIPDSVKKIGTRCFEGCTGLKKVVLPSGLKVIDEYVFRECSSLEEIVIPDSVTKIAKGAFMGCGSLSKVVLPKKLKTIEEYAFSNCKIEISPVRWKGLRKMPSWSARSPNCASLAMSNTLAVSATQRWKT